MNPQREDPRMQTTHHELIHGRTGSGKTNAVRQLLADEVRTEHVQTWIADLHMAVPEYTKTATKYACTVREIEDLLVELLAEAHTRAEQMAALNLTEFVPGDHRHELPLISVTIEAADVVLVDRRRRSLVERTIQMARKSGITFRLVVPKAHVGWFGGSELIRSAMAGGRVFACEKASA